MNGPVNFIANLPNHGSTLSGRGTSPVAGKRRLRAFFRALRYLAAAPVAATAATLGAVAWLLLAGTKALADLAAVILPPEGQRPQPAGNGAPGRQAQDAPFDFAQDGRGGVIIPFHHGLDISQSRRSSSPRKGGDFTGDAA